MFLVGDIGGTNSRFAIARTTAADDIVISDFERFTSEDDVGLDDTMSQFVSKIGHVPDLAVLAVAGPIHNDEVHFTNRKWHLSADDLRQKCGINNIRLLNDFTAMAYSVPRMSDDSFIDLKPGHAIDATPMLVAGPGTGFGSCLLVPQGGDWQALACEGGHSLYAPRNDLERAVCAVLNRHDAYISIEKFCAGGYLDTLATALAEVMGKQYTPIPPHAIIERALAGDVFCRQLCDMRADAIMSSLANMALVGGARGGVVLAGGVSRRLIDFLSQPETIARFASVWPQNDFLADIPIRILVNPLAPLVGAAAYHLNHRS